MEELTGFEILANRMMYLCGWIINQIRYMFGGATSVTGFNSDLIWLTFGLFFAFAALHIFKRILRKD